MTNTNEIVKGMKENRCRHGFCAWISWLEVSADFLHQDGLMKDLFVGVQTWDSNMFDMGGHCVGSDDLNTRFAVLVDWDW